MISYFNKIKTLVHLMKYNVDILETTKSYESRKSRLALIGEDADKLSELIQYILKFGEE